MHQKNTYHCAPVISPGQPRQILGPTVDLTHPDDLTLVLSPRNTKSTRPPHNIGQKYTQPPTIIRPSSMETVLQLTCVPLRADSTGNFIPLAYYPGKLDYVTRQPSPAFEREKRESWKNRPGAASSAGSPKPSKSADKNMNQPQQHHRTGK